MGDPLIKQSVARPLSAAPAIFVPRSWWPTVIITVSLVVVVGPLASGETSISALTRPPTDVRNSHYLSNRPPLQPAAFVKLPIGSVKPRGWLLETLRRQRAGLAGRLQEVSAWLQEDGNAWVDPQGRGKWGWEEVPYWLRGSILLAQLLDDGDLNAETVGWIEAVLASKRPNGDFGPRRIFGDDDSPDLWANILMLSCLQSYYECTADPRVLELMLGYCRYVATIPDEKMLTHFWQYYRGGDLLEVVYWLFNHTEEEWLLGLAEKVHRNTANWRLNGDLPSWHGVNIAQAFGEPATYYLQSGDSSDLRAAYDNFRLVRKSYGRFPGGMFAADENARVGYRDPRQAIETCAVVEQIRSDQQLLVITGDPLWADHVEDVAFNTFPATLAPDYRSLRYLTSPNLVVSDSRDYSPGIENVGPMFNFNPLSHRCCQHNHTQGWPRFIEYLWLATNDHGLLAACYGPSVVEAVVGDGVAVRVVETTRYPFEEQVVFDITPDSPAKFPLYLRIPAWSKRTEVTLNDVVVAENIAQGGYVRIEHRWKHGDTVTLRMPMDVRVHRWRDNHNSISVSRGPITYALRIGSTKVVVDPTDTAAVDSQWRPVVDLEAWPAFELHPTTPWNYGLVLEELPVEDNFRVEHREWPRSNYPFAPDSSPVAIRCEGKRIPEWTVDLTGMCGRLQQSPAYSEAPTEPLTLLPMGAAPLRISVFPEAGDDRGLRRWRGVASTDLSYTPAASYCSADDRLSAMADGLLPCASSDQAIPRLTFLPRTGTTEWLQADFDQPRDLRSVSVYWCDDSSRYDHAPTGPFDKAINEADCRVPASWRLLYRDGQDWKPVQTDGPYGTDVNRFNVTSFAPVVTTALRIEVQLAPEASAGVLEWRIGGSTREPPAAAQASDNSRDASP
ncbi:beta-L-arabinofuranosidase domain-containing protein [Botrimarina hoheduenensis]|uniref:Non-reducing end beta-L-arabinofuranosidase n=1 Tax=Botrimarina hoheduenensis TaxID=2528000 RepID=A0A5C5VXE5_9BACT|nr:beta-L-arabinofuranosidase domain-containing protein [Botrimarina hoheduenensis]TWT42655.1 hypothetical protein Pla111_26270 [Botrimarina hoheduenensis]